MELSIMSPAYYTDIFGIDNDIYRMCRALAGFVKDKEYSEHIKYLGIIPIIAPSSAIEQYKPGKRIELKAGVAVVYSTVNYEEYVTADLPTKKSMIMKNVLDAVKSVSGRGKIDFNMFKTDVEEFCTINSIQVI